MYALTEDIKKEEVKEEEATEATEEVVEEVSEPSELEEAQARAEEFENKYLRAHAEMQNIQRRSNEERQQLQKYRSQDLAKAILPSLDNLERALAVEGLTDDVKKGLEMVQESLVHALKEKGLKKFQQMVISIITSTWLFKQCLQMMNIQQIRLHKFSKKGINSTNASYAQLW